MSINLSTYKHRAEHLKVEGQTINFKFGKRFSDKKKEVLYRELAMLLRAGVDFKKALEILAQQEKGKLERSIILAIKDKVVGGKGIYEAMMSSGHFSAYEYFSIQIGEETRRLEEVLTELQKFYNRKIQMRRQIISVLTYPAIVLVVTLLVLYFMLNKVVPMFSSVFKQFGSELPKSTQYILAISQNSGTIFTSVGLIFALVITGHYTLRKKDKYRRITANIVLKIPYFGNLIRKIYLSRFCQAMNLLVSSRTALMHSLTLTGKMIGFYPVEASIRTIKEDITRGASLSDSLRKHTIYENKMISMIEVAEQVNQLDTMFEKLSDQYNEEISHQTKMIGVILEPMIIIIIGVVVGVIMVSMYAPMFDLSKIINN